MAKDKVLQPVNKSKKYTHILDNMLLRRLLEGREIQSICDEWGISRTTFYHWVDIYPGFQEAFKEGTTEKVAKVAEAMYRTALGYKVQEVTTKEKNGKIVAKTTADKYIQPNYNAQKTILATQSEAKHKWRESSQENDSKHLDSVIKGIDDLVFTDVEVIEDE